MGGDSATLCCQQRELRRVADGFLLQEDQDPEARGLVVSGAAMWCWSWLLVRTGVCWEGGDYYRAVRRASRQVGIHGSFVFLSPVAEEERDSAETLSRGLNKFQVVLLVQPL